MKVYREIMTSEQLGTFGFTLTTTVGEDSWTSKWVPVPTARSHEDVNVVAQDVVALLVKYDEGD